MTFGPVTVDTSAFSMAALAANSPASALVVWRHPRPMAAHGRCIGRTDLPVDRRKSKRLAHRIRAWARRHAAAPVVFTSPLARAADVGRWLARWGWRHHVDARLSELDFGAWDGAEWASISQAQVDAWCADFAHHRPGGGESVSGMLARSASFRADVPAGCVVAHAGWISAACWLKGAGAGCSGGSGRSAPEAALWPVAVAYGERVELRQASCPAASAS